MHNTYINSTIYSLRSSGCLSFSFNDYPYFLNEKFERNTIRISQPCWACDSCCVLSVQRVPVGSYLCGLRQSTLLQRSAYRKLVLGGGDRFYKRIPSYRLDRGSYGVSSSFKDRSVCNTSRRRRKERCCCMVEEENDEIYDSDHVDDVEALLSLLSEEVDEEYVGGGKRRNGMSFRRVEVERKGSWGAQERSRSPLEKVRVDRKGSCGGQERNRSSLEKVQVERGEKYDSKCDSRKKSNVGLRLVESKSKANSVRTESRNGSLGSQERNVISSERIQVETCGSCGSKYDREKKIKGGLRRAESNSKAGSESIRVESSKEDSRCNEQTGALTRSDGHKERNVSSSCSSYYSFSSSADFDSEIDVRNKHGQLIKESLTGYEYTGGKGDKFDGQLVEEYKNHIDDLEVHGEVSERRDTKSRMQKDDLEVHGEVSEQRNATAGVCLNWDIRKKSEKKLNNALDEEIKPTRRSSQMHAKVLQSHENKHGNLDKSANKQHSQEVNKVETATNVVGQARGEHHLASGHIAAKESNLNTQHLIRMSEVQDFVRERTSFQQSHSNTALTDRQQNWNIVDLDPQTGQHIIGELNSRRSHPSTHISEIDDRYSENISMMQSEMSRRNHVKSTNLVSVSSLASAKYHPQKVQKSPQKFEFRTGSSNAIDTPLVHASDPERYDDSQGMYEDRVAIQETISAGRTQATEVSIQLSEGLNKFSPRNEDESRGVSHFIRRDLEEASTSLASSDMVTLVNMKEIDVQEEEGRRSEALVPPLPQMVATSSLRVEPMGEITSHEVSKTSSESGSSALNVNSRVPQTSLYYQPDRRNGRGETHEEYSYLITPEGPSADGFQKSSTQFVGEFNEKARNEATPSEIEEAENISKTNLVITDKTYVQKTSNQHASEDLQLKKEHHNRLSFGGSGTKGPSDNMWDVTDPSIPKTPGEEETEASTNTGETTGRRTGRSFWSIVADIARLKWGSCPETPSSAARQSERASPKESVSSEVYSSARETEDNKNTSASHARDKSLQLEIKSEQVQPRKLFSHDQGQGSDKMRSTNERVTETSPSTSIAESGLASKGISLSSGDGTLVCNEDVIGSQGTTAGTEIVELVIPPNDRGKQSTVVTEISKATSPSVFRSGLGEQMEQSGCEKVNEVSGTEGKDGELKRRKLQRSPQLPQDRFEEWEEAYRLESEQQRVDETFMREALLEAKKAADYWEVPVGAVLVQNGKVIARGYNLVEELRDSTAHAEMMCIREASNVLRSWRLAGTTLYVTLEPCPMCAGAILQARIDNLVWGAPNKLLGADGSWIRLFPDGDERGPNLELSDKPAPPPHPFHPKINVRRGVMASECADTMQQFFQLRRKKKTKQAEMTEPSSSSVITSHHPSKFLRTMHDVFHIFFCL